MKEYALYKGEELLMIGTIKELAEKFEVKEKTIRFYGTTTSKKRDKGNRKVLIRLEDYDNE